MATDDSDRFRILFENAPDPHLLLDLKGQLLDANLAALRLCGLTREELSQTIIFQLPGLPADQTAKAQEILAANAQGQAVDEEVLFHDHEGNALILEIRSQPLELDGQALALWVARANGRLGELMVERQRADAILRHRLLFERTVTVISSRFVGVQNIDDAITTSLADMCSLSKASRAYLFLFHPDGLLMSNTHEWCIPGIRSQMENRLALPVDRLRWWMRKLRGGKVIHIKNVQLLPPEAQAERELLEGQGVKSLLAFPLYVAEKLDGFIGFDDVLDAGEWNLEDLALLRTSSEIIGNALKHKWSEDALRQSEERYRTLIERAPLGVFSTDGEGHIQVVNSSLLKILGSPSAEVTKTINLLTFPPLIAAGVSGALKRCLSNQELVCLEFPYTSHWGKEVHCRLHLSPNTDDQGRISGAQGLVEDITDHKMAEERLQESFTKLKQTLDETVNALTITIERRDPYTSGHQRRVTSLACAIATEMALPEEKIKGISIAGLLHDIGKIIVPSDILSKPGTLTRAERMIIKDHTEVGYDILKSIDFQWPVAEIVLQHHERMDGSGYPRGLGGLDIILEARILGVADVVEAMSSHRPYRPSLGLDEALKEITRNRGVLYDEIVVDTCLDIILNKGFKLDRGIVAAATPYLMAGWD